MIARSPLDREIARLAVPALGALVAEPLFLLTDTAMVGHLGVTELGALGIASAVLATVVGLMIFLAYAVTPAVARQLGAGNRAGAVRSGLDGMWLAALLGVGLGGFGLVSVGPVVGAFGAGTLTSDAAQTYITISLIGLPAMLVVIAANGLLRGLQDTRTPLVVAGVGFTANAVLNAVLIYGLGWGLAGSAAGTVLAQWGMAVYFVLIALRAAGAEQVKVAPGFGGLGALASTGGWLLLRTAALRAALVATVVVATGQGVDELAGVHIALTLFFSLSLVLDALAIAAQAMVGHALGAEDSGQVRAITRRLVQLGVGGGALLAVPVAALAPVIGGLFTPDAEVRAVVTPLVLVLALGLPVAGLVFVLDGVLIGAGDAAYLAVTGLINLAVYLPLLLLAGGSDNPTVLWASFTFGFMAARGATLSVRAFATTRGPLQDV